MFRKAWNGVFGVIADTAETTRDGIDNVNHYVRENTKANKKLITANAQMRMTKGLREHQEELNADPSLKALYEELTADWDGPIVQED